MVPVLSEWGSIYNVRTGETFILDSNCEGKLYGFYCTETPLATLVDEGEDGIPYDAALYAIETCGADMQHLDALPGSELPDPLAIEAPVANDDFVGAIDTVLCYMEQTAIDLELRDDLFDFSGWTLAERRQHHRDVRHARGRHVHGPGARRSRERRRAGQGGREVRRYGRRAERRHQALIFPTRRRRRNR